MENTGQPLIAGALRESLEIAQRIQPQMLIATNFGLCATVNGELVIKAPDWLYVPNVKEQLAVRAQPTLRERNSYTPNLEGDVPLLVMEFLSETEGGEYSIKPTYPPGKWFFYEQILQVPIYIIFEPKAGLLELYRLQNGKYELEQPDENGRHWLPEIDLYLGIWTGTKTDRNGYWLRWWNQSAAILPWAVEQIEAERQRAEQESQRADREREEKEKLIAYLRAKGLDPNDLT